MHIVDLHKYMKGYPHDIITSSSSKTQCLSRSIDCEGKLDEMPMLMMACRITWGPSVDMGGSIKPSILAQTHSTIATAKAIMLIQ